MATQFDPNAAYSPAQTATPTQNTQPSFDPNAGYSPVTPDHTNGFVSTLGSDLSGLVKGVASLPGKVYDYATTPTDPAAAQAQENTEEAHKTAVYKQFSDDMHAGNYSKAFSGLADLFDPSYDDQNDPLAQAMKSQWDSSAQAKDAMVAAAKKGDTLGVIQHAAGVLPVASQVDAAMTNYQKDPTRENLAHVVSAAVPAFVPSLVKGASAATGAVSDAISDTADATPEPGILKPGYETVSDTDIPVRAQGKVAKAAESVASPDALKNFEVNQTQPAVRLAAGNIASDVANTETPTAVSPKADPFGFGQAADELKTRTSAGFQKVDDWSDGKFSDAQDEADTARGSLDFAGKKAYQQALQNQNDLLDQYSTAHPNEDVSSLKSDWRQKIGFDELATRFNRSVGPTPAELTTPGQPDLGYVNPTTFRNAVIDATQNGEFEKAGFTPQHIQSIEDLGRILEQAKPASGLNATIGSVAKYLGRRAVGAAVGGAIGGVPGAIVGGLAEHGAEWAAGKILGGVMTDVPAIQTLTSGLATGASPNVVGKSLAERLKNTPQRLHIIPVPSKNQTVKVSSDPEPGVPETDDGPEAPDVTPSALTGTPNPSIADALGTTKPEMPKMATGRDYLDNPTSLNGLNKLYQAAGPSLFVSPQGAQQQPEKLVPIAQDGSFGQTSTGGGRDGKGAMHATATIPSDSQAIIHTHPFGQDPMPSYDDYATATKTGKPNFVMSGSAIYVAMPGGSTKNPIKVADISHGKGGKLNIKWN